MQPATPPSGQFVDFQMGPEETPSGPPGVCPPWSQLSAWAAHYGVDDDLALLLCACAAAHAAGPGLSFEGASPSDRMPAPTVISTIGNTGFQRAAKGAIESLLPIQQDLLERYGDPVEKPVFKDPATRVKDMIEAEIAKYHARTMPLWRNPAGDMDPDKQPYGPVRFILEGALPAKPVRFLRRCHSYAALALTEIEPLPRSIRSRDARIDLLASMVGGYRNGGVSIRGFMQFAQDYLEWMAANNRDLLVKTLPVESPGDAGEVPSSDGTGEMREFDRLHRRVLRRVLGLRFSRSDCSVDFRNRDAARRFRKLREGYRAENYAVAHLEPASLILPDLFAWYLLQLGKSAYLKIDEMEVAGHAITAARRLRRRVAVFYDRQVAVKRAHERLALATKLVARMRRLDRPCKRRDLARGLDKQRMDRIAPVIDLLVGLGVFTRTSKLLSMSKAGEIRPLRVDDFMEPLLDVPFSATRQLDQAEERQTALSATTAEPQFRSEA